jgi:predicted permease
MRILFGLILGIATASIFKLDSVASKVVILQSAMPPAIFNFVLAEKYNQDSERVASIILAGTLISVITTPVIIGFLLY